MAISSCCSRTSPGPTSCPPPAESSSPAAEPSALRCGLRRATSWLRACSYQGRLFNVFTLKLVHVDGCGNV